MTSASCGATSSAAALALSIIATDGRDVALAGRGGAGARGMPSELGALGGAPGTVGTGRASLAMCDGRMLGGGGRMLGGGGRDPLGNGRTLEG